MNTPLKKRLLVLALLCAAPLSIAAVTVNSTASNAIQQPKDGQDGKDGKDGRQGREGHGAPAGSLEESMQMIQGATKRIDKAFGKKDVPAILTSLIDMQKAVQEAKTKSPPKAEDIKDAKEKEAFVNGFRRQLVEMQRALCDVEIGLIDNKLDDAKKVFDTTVKPMKKAGHDKYKGN